MRLLTIAATGVTGCAGLIFGLYALMGWRMSEQVASLLKVGLFFGLALFTLMAIIGLAHGRIAGLRWWRRHIQLRSPIRYWPGDKPERPPVANAFFHNPDLRGLLATNPYVTLGMIVHNFSGEVTTIGNVVDGRMHCLGELCDDLPTVSPTKLGASPTDRRTFQIRQRISPEIARRVREVLAKGETVNFDLGSIRIDGAYLLERRITIRGPIHIEDGSEDMGNVIRWEPVLASQTYYDGLGHPKEQ